MSIHVIYYENGAKHMRPISSQAEFIQLRNSARQQELVAKARTGDEEAKRKLVQFNYSCLPNDDGTLRGSTRASNTVGMDIDLTEAENEAEQQTNSIRNRILSVASELGLCMFERSVNKGYHIAFLRHPEMTNEQNIRWAANLIGINFDKCAIDLTRVFFGTTGSTVDLLYVGDSLFDNTTCYELPKPSSSSSSLSLSSSESSSSSSSSSESSSSSSSSSSSESEPSSNDPEIPKNPDLYFQGILFEIIVLSLVERFGGCPPKGLRNRILFEICKNLADITDRNPDLIFRICPRFGLSEDEVRRTCQNACHYSHNSRMRAPIYKTLQSLGINCSPAAIADASHAKAESDEEIMKNFDKPSDSNTVTHPFPDTAKLPPLIKEFVATAPEDFREATAMVCLSVCGFLGSRLRSKYIDEALQAPSFIVNIIAPAASGKSELLRVPDFCLRKVREMDEEGRALECEYERQKKLLKNSKKQIEEPHPIVRDLPAKVSVAQLLKRTKYAQGLHLISIVAEIDTMTTSNKAGTWSQKTDIYRVAQDSDGGRYGQDYISDASFNATCQMRYNLVTLGTPGAMARAYPDIEDGLITRCIMVALPDQFGKQMPLRAPMTKHQLQVVNSKIDALMALCQDSEGNVLPEHVISLPWLCQAISEWVESERLRAVRDNDRARDQFRRRAALIGFRAGMVAAFLWGKLDRKRKNNTIEFSLWVAEFVLNSLLERYSQKVNEEATTYETPKSTRYPSLYDTMGDTFTVQDLRRAAVAQGCRSPIKSIIYFWNANGLIEKQSDSFVKLVK